MARPFADNPFSGLFGAFQAAVNDPAIRAQAGGVQAYVWQSIRNDYASRGEALPAGSFQAVNQLLSLAGQQRAAALRLERTISTAERTGLDQALTGDRIAPSIHSRALEQQAGGAQFQVIYRATFLVDGEPVERTLTHDFGFDLPQSLSSLQDTIEGAARIHAQDYEYEFGGDVVPIEIRSY